MPVFQVDSGHRKFPTVFASKSAYILKNFYFKYNFLYYRVILRSGISGAIVSTISSLVFIALTIEHSAALNIIFYKFNSLYTS